MRVPEIPIQQMTSKLLPQNPSIRSWKVTYLCHGQKSRFFGDGRPPTFNRNPYHGYINPYYWVDDHPLLYGNNGSLDSSTYIPF